MNIKTSRKGTITGTWSLDELHDAVEKGDVLPSDYVWRSDFSEWRKLSEAADDLGLGILSPGASSDAKYPDVIGGPEQSEGKNSRSNLALSYIPVVVLLVLYAGWKWLETPNTTESDRLSNLFFAPDEFEKAWNNLYGNKSGNYLESISFNVVRDMGFVTHKAELFDGTAGIAHARLTEKNGDIYRYVVISDHPGSIRMLQGDGVDLTEVMESFMAAFALTVRLMYIMDSIGGDELNTTAEIIEPAAEFASYFYGDQSYPSCTPGKIYKGINVWCDSVGIPVPTRCVFAPVSESAAVRENFCSAISSSTSDE